MKTLAERINWILETKGLSARALAIAANVSPNYIGLLRKGERGGRGLNGETARRIAAAGGVDLGWLQTGEGSPEGETLDDPYPARVQALALLQGRVAAEVRVALRVERPSEPWDVERWIERAKELQRVYEKVVKDF